MWCDETRTKCAQAMITWLKESYNVKRPINHLTLKDFECMAECATGTYIVEASRRIKDEPDSLEGLSLTWIL